MKHTSYNYLVTRCTGRSGGWPTEAGFDHDTTLTTVRDPVLPEIEPTTLNELVESRNSDHAYVKR